MNRRHMHYKYPDIFGNGRRVYEDPPKDDKGEGGKGAAGEEKETVAKGEYDRVLSELEEMREEVLSPEYLEYLQARDKPKDKPADKAADGGELVYGLTQTQIEAMSKAELAKHISKSVKEESAKEVLKVKEELTSGEKANVKKEIAAFGRTHADFVKYRPAMHGLSLDPKNADLTLQELYDKAKEMYPSGPTKEEKEKAAKLKGEKPGGSNESYERLKKLTPEEIAAEAMKETKEALGIERFPEA